MKQVLLPRQALRCGTEQLEGLQHPAWRLHLMLGCLVVGMHTVTLQVYQWCKVLQ